MSRSTDPGHFFQTTASLSEITRKAQKSTNTHGSPIRLPSKILSIGADPDDAGRVYVAEAAGTARRVVLETGEISALYTGPAAPLTSLALSPSPTSSAAPRTLYAGCWDKTIWSWNATTRAPLRRFTGGHTDFVKALLCLRLGGRDILVSGGADGAIVVWDARSGEKLYRLMGHVRGILSLAVDPASLGSGIEDGRSGVEGETVTLFSGSSDRETRRWRLTASAGNELADDAATGPVPILAHETSVNALRFDADADLWTASADKSAKCLVRDRGWEADTTLPHPDFVRDVVVDEEGGWIVTACRDEEVRVWERGTGKLYHTFSGHFEEVTGLLLVGRMLVSVSIDATVRKWSLAPQDLQAAKLEAEKAREGEVVEEKEEPKESMLTAEEEAELAELMDDSD
ncbi:hypothetical protein W97_00926 [Coniosporium apollinis CBS 100218]|uniref:Uncharacterized protein n=1 Tax=Coniosporium apollinis (strain CBS 100218) TaxID=1168221 RepID=R7YIH4_CONA1|nr:uncharacterized protein W97_00926 [Coniosporium apollinis CBS 100218]EON61710.1 hypothetical protein W97_00926 [Coniosporium apollinis CBS 100218]